MSAIPGAPGTPMNRRSFLQFSAAGIAVAGLGVTVAGCSTESGPSGTAGGGTASAGSTAGAAPTGPTKLAVALNGVSGIKTFNQGLAYDGASWFLGTSIFSRLVVMDYGPDFAIHPQLADTWEVNDDATMYTFNLVKNAKWHDGEPVTSKDVKSSYEGFVKYAGPAAAMLRNIESIETPDDYTVVFNMSEPDAALMYGIATYPRTPILPAHLYDGTDWTANEHNLKPIGSGPFKFVSLDSTQVVMQRNDDYFGDKPYITDVVAQFVPEQQTAIEGVKAGQFHCLHTPPALGQITQLRDVGVKVEAPPGPWMCYLGMNASRSQLANPEVRKALLYAVNRDDVTAKASGGAGKAAQNPYVSGISWAFDPTLSYPSHDPKKAGELLDAAGFPMKGDSRFGLSLIVSTAQQFYVDAANVVSAQLAQVGITVDIQQMDDAAFQAAAPKLKHDLVIYALWIGPDPNEWNQLLRTVDADAGTGFRNWFAYSNKTVDGLFDQGVQFSSQDARKEYYNKIAKIVADDLPYIGMFEAPYSFAHTGDFEGFFSQDGTISYRMDLTKVRPAAK